MPSRSASRPGRLHPEYWRSHHLDALAVTVHPTSPAALAPRPVFGPYDDSTYVPTLSRPDVYDALLEVVCDPPFLKWCIDDYLDDDCDVSMPISAHTYTRLDALYQFEFLPPPNRYDVASYLSDIIEVVFSCIYPSDLDENVCLRGDSRFYAESQNVVELVFHTETTKLRFAGSLEFAYGQTRITPPILAILETRGYPIPKIVAYLLAFAQSYFRSQPNATVASPYIITTHQHRAVVTDDSAASTRWIYTVYTSDVHREYLESLDKFDHFPATQKSPAAKGSLDVKASRDFELSSGEQRVDLAKLLSDLIPKLIARSVNELGGIKEPKKILTKLNLERCEATRRAVAAREEAQAKAKAKAREEAQAKARARAKKSRALKRKLHQPDPEPVANTTKRRKLESTTQNTLVAV